MKNVLLRIVVFTVGFGFSQVLFLSFDTSERRSSTAAIALKSENLSTRETNTSFSSSLPIVNESSDGLDNDFSLQWNNIASLRLSKAERQRFEEYLLVAWARHDPESALIAALTEVVGSDDPSAYQRLLVGPFSEYLASSPKQTWLLINSELLSPAQKYIAQKIWIDAVGEKDPEACLEGIYQLGEVAQVRGMQHMLENTDAKIVWERLVDVIERSGDEVFKFTELVSKLVTSTNQRFSKEELLEMATGESSGIAKLAAWTLAQKYENGTGVEVMESDMAKLPSQLQVEFAKSLMTRSDEDPRIAVVAMNKFFDENEWGPIYGAYGSVPFESFVKMSDPQALTKFAFEFPENDMSKELFQTMVLPFFAESSRQDVEIFLDADSLPRFWQEYGKKFLKSIYGE